MPKGWYQQQLLRKRSVDLADIHPTRLKYYVQVIFKSKEKGNYKPSIYLMKMNISYSESENLDSKLDKFQYNALIKYKMFKEYDKTRPKIKLSSTRNLMCSQCLEN